MKYFLVKFKNGSEDIYRGTGYRREGEQYVFDDPESSEVSFVVADEVMSIVETQRPGSYGGGSY